MTKHSLDKPCPYCFNRGMVFYESRRLSDPEGLSEKAIGLLSCPVCGHEDYCALDLTPYGGNLNVEERP